MFLKLIEIFVIILTIWFLITQAIIPFISNSPWFPIFKSRRKKLEKELENAKETAEENKLKKEIKNVR